MTEQDINETIAKRMGTLGRSHPGGTGVPPVTNLYTTDYHALAAAEREVYGGGSI